MAKYGTVEVEVKIDDEAVRIIMKQMEMLLERIEKLEEDKQDKIIKQFTIG
jgi:uncharacterized protein (UPF0335 family)